MQREDGGKLPVAVLTQALRLNQKEELKMKTDRFMKVMLVVIALLLALNCANGIRAPFLGNSTEAAAPPRFLQSGKIYHLRGGDLAGDFKVTTIEDSGWIKVTQWNMDKNQPVQAEWATSWVNIANILLIRE